jgi:hypothetical protein
MPKQSSGRGSKSGTGGGGSDKEGENKYMSKFEMMMKRAEAMKAESDRHKEVLKKAKKERIPIPKVKMIMKDGSKKDYDRTTLVKAFHPAVKSVLKKHGTNLAPMKEVVKHMSKSTGVSGKFITKAFANDRGLFSEIHAKHGGSLTPSRRSDELMVFRDRNGGRRRFGYYRKN